MLITGDRVWAYVFPHLFPPFRIARSARSGPKRAGPAAVDTGGLVAALLGRPLRWTFGHMRAFGKCVELGNLEVKGRNKAEVPARGRDPQDAHYLPLRDSAAPPALLVAQANQTAPAELVDRGL